MAIYHLAVKTICRSDGRSATAAAAYRAAAKIQDDRTGLVHDYARRRGVEIALLCTPDGAPEWAQDRAQLWNAAEAAERRKDARVAREFEAALPAELGPQQRKDLALELAQALVDRYGIAADLCIHRPHGHGDDRNHHVHILCSTRQLGPEGFGAKTRQLDDSRQSGPELEHCRALWAELSNRALERAGHQERIDHRSLSAQRGEAQERGDGSLAQELERAPTVHLGPAASAIERRGRKSRTGERCRERLQLTREAQELRQETQALGAQLADIARDLAQQEKAQDKAEQARPQTTTVESAHPSPTLIQPARKAEDPEQPESSAAKEDAGSVPLDAPSSVGLLQSTFTVTAKQVLFEHLRPSVRQNGDVLYQLGDGGRVVDQVHQVKVERVSSAAMNLALDLAQERFGDGLILVFGTAEFQRQAGILAAARGMQVRLIDPDLEAARAAAAKQTAQVRTLYTAPQETTAKGQAPSGEPLGRTYLSVPYEEKDQASALGARWDRPSECWYAPAGTALGPLARWLPRQTQAPEPQVEQSQEPQQSQTSQEKASPEPSAQDRQAKEQRAWLSRAQSMTLQQLERAEVQERPGTLEERIATDQQVKESFLRLRQAQSAASLGKSEVLLKETLLKQAERSVDRWHKENWAWSKLHRWNLGRAGDLEELNEAVTQRRGELGAAREQLPELEKAQEQATERWEQAAKRAEPSAEQEHRRQSERHAEITRLLRERRKEKAALQPSTEQQLVEQYHPMVANAARRAEQSELKRSVSEELGEVTTALTHKKEALKAWRNENPKLSWLHDKGLKRSKPLGKLEENAQELLARAEELRRAKEASEAALLALEKERKKLDEEIRPGAKAAAERQQREFQRWRERYEPEDLKREREAALRQKQQLERASRSKGQQRGGRGG